MTGYVRSGSTSVLYSLTFSFLFSILNLYSFFSSVLAFFVLRKTCLVKKLFLLKCKPNSLASVAYSISLLFMLILGAL